MKIVWTEFAIENLKDIFDYYSNKASKRTAHKILKQILNSTKQLVESLSRDCVKSRKSNYF